MICRRLGDRIVVLRYIRSGCLFRRLRFFFDGRRRFDDRRFVLHFDTRGVFETRRHFGLALRSFRQFFARHDGIRFRDLFIDFRFRQLTIQFGDQNPRIFRADTKNTL